MSGALVQLPVLSLALSGLPRSASNPAATLHEHLDIAASLAYRAITLDAMLPGVRARELDRSARRDLASLLRRRELACAGIDLWIPPTHFTNPAEQDRALAALLGTIELAADLSRLAASAVVSTARPAMSSVVSVTLPQSLAPDVRSAIESKASTCGVRVADHTFPIPELTASTGSPHDFIGVGIDPAAVLLASDAPAACIHRLHKQSPNRLALARLSDASSVSRIPVGAPSARLDVLSYAMSLVTSEYRGYAAVDVRGLLDPFSGAQRAFTAWQAPLSPN